MNRFIELLSRSDLAAWIFALAGIGVMLLIALWG